MKENCTVALLKTFVKLHEESILYRANRLINWCIKLNIVMPNLKVVNKEFSDRILIDVPDYDRKIEFDILVHFEYDIKGTDETIAIATTRPENLLENTDIAVHFDDKRFQHLIDKIAIYSFNLGRLMSIVADDYDKKNFNIDTVKITSAHDLNDFTLGSRHNLEFINILIDDDRMNENAERRFQED